MSNWLMCIALSAVISLLIEESNADCKLLLTKREVNANYRNSYGRTVCCRISVIITDSYALCLNVSFTLNQNLEDVIDYPDASEISGYEKFLKFNYLKFANSYVPIIFVSLFNNLGSITRLYMNSTNVNEIQPGGFNGLSQLEVLHLGDNNLTEINRGTLNSLSALVTLNMSNNHIHVIENNAFIGLVKLQELLLNHNELKVLSDATFPLLKFIKIIDLSHNIIFDFAENVFSNSSQYSDLSLSENFQLNLSFNNLTRINTTNFPENINALNLDHNNIKLCFFNFSRLSNLSLNDNSISNITVLGKQLSYFGASKNKLSEINFNIFQSFEELVTLDLSQNIIEVLHEDMFENLTKLNYLFLNDNQIRYLPVGCFNYLIALKTLNISGNQISEIEYGTFSGLNRLETLDISNNTLTYLYESTLHTLPLLENFLLHDNLITTLDPYGLLLHLKWLKTVSFNNNPWDCKSLLTFFSQMTNNNIAVFNGSERKVVNVHGIACHSNDHFVTPTINIGSNDAINMKPFNEFFDKEFFNTSFYKYFRDYTNLHTQEESFLRKFENSFNNIVNTFRNFSLQVNNEQKMQLKHYFNSKFENSSFYKYLNKDWSSDNTFSTVFTNLNALKQFFNVDFTNSSFYKFFQKNFVLNNKLETINDAPKTEKLINNNHQVITLSSDLQNNVNTFFVIIIVVLCLLLLLFVAKNFTNPLNKLNKRNLITADSHTNVELL